MKNLTHMNKKTNIIIVTDKKCWGEKDCMLLLSNNLVRCVFFCVNTFIGHLNLYLFFQQKCFRYGFLGNKYSEHTFFNNMVGVKATNTKVVLV